MRRDARENLPAKTQLPPHQNRNKGDSTPVRPRTGAPVPNRSGSE